MTATVHGPSRQARHLHALLEPVAHARTPRSGGVALTNLERSSMRPTFSTSTPLFKGHCIMSLCRHSLGRSASKSA